MEDSRVQQPFSHVGPGPIISFLCLSSFQLIKTDVPFYQNSPGNPSSLFEACGWVNFPGTPTPDSLEESWRECGCRLPGCAGAAALDRKPPWPQGWGGKFGEDGREGPGREGSFSARAVCDTFIRIARTSFLT